MSECASHNWQYQGVVWSFGNQRAGSSACDIIYEDRYYCTRCLMIKDSNKRTQGNSYEHRIFGTMPK